MTGTEVERVAHRRAALPGGLRRRQGAGGRPAPRRRPAAGSAAVDTGDGERTIVCGAPNVAAGQTVAVALPGARMPGGEKLAQGEAARRRARSGMILAADRAGDRRGRTTGILVLDDGARRGHAAGRGAAAGRAGAGDRGDARTGSTASASTASRARSTRSPPRRSAPEPWAEDAPADGEGDGRRLRLGHGRGRPTSARASPPGSSPTCRSAPRRPGCRRGSRRPGSARSTTSSTSPTT